MNDRATLDRIASALTAEAAQLQQPTEFIQGMRYAVAFIGGYAHEAVDLRADTLEAAAKLAETMPAMTKAVPMWLRQMARAEQHADAT